MTKKKVSKRVLKKRRVPSWRELVPYGPTLFDRMRSTVGVHPADARRHDAADGVSGRSREGVRRFVLVEGGNPDRLDAYAVDTPAQEEEAKRAMVRHDIEVLHIWYGHPDDPDAYESKSSVLFAR